MILASHVLEHVPFHIERYGHTKNFLIMFMEEMWRILKPAGRVEIIVPGGISSFAYAIDHKRIVTAKTFHVFYPNDEWSYYTDCRFELIKEYREDSFKFRVFRKLMLRLFDTDVDLLSPKNRHIVLQKIN
jgi:predicted SAM-dependent methyltransferase